MGDLKKFRQKSGEKFHHQLDVVPTFTTRRNREGKKKCLPYTGNLYSRQREDIPAPCLKEDEKKEGLIDWLKKPLLKK